MLYSVERSCDRQIMVVLRDHCEGSKQIKLGDVETWKMLFPASVFSLLVVYMCFFYNSSVCVLETWEYYWQSDC